MPTYRLGMRSGPSSGKEYILEKSELFVGRDLNNDIVINDPEVSRRHARFFLQGTFYVLEDLGSTNGTFINGQRLAAPYPLRPGDVITFGERIDVGFDQVVEDQGATVVSTPSRPADIPYQAPIPGQAVQQSASQGYETAPAYAPPPTRPLSQSSAPVHEDFAGQVPYQEDVVVKPASRRRTIMIIAIVLLVVVCLCVAAGLWFAPKEFWCVLPVWPAGACP